MIKITEQMERIFLENPLYSKDGQGMNAKVIARFYIPGTSIQWFVTEASKEDGKWILYGYAHIFEWEWGYVSLQEMMDIKFHDMTMEVVLYEENMQKSISEFI